MDHGVAPAENFDWAIIFANKVTDNFNTVATKIDDATATCLLIVPEPSAMWARVSFTRTYPEHITDCAILNRFNCFKSFRCVAEIF